MGCYQDKTLDRSALQAAVITVMVFFCYCNPVDKPMFAIRDFKKSLQPYLLHVVSRGIVGHDSATRYIQLRTTVEELERLSKSEHPVLRAIAFEAMLERPEFDHFAVIMNNLSDTAVVSRDQGEWGFQHIKVSDHIIENGRWKDTAALQKTIEKLILHNNYLTTAYTALTKIEPGPEHYSSIRKMAERYRRNEEETGESTFTDIHFNTREYALFALAKYKKPEDIAFIHQVLFSHTPDLSPESFHLMQEYPHESYMEIYEDYFAHRFYHKICREQSTYSAEPFITSVATYKNERSAEILNAILNRKPLLPCPGDRNTIERTTAYAIWENKCTAYAKLMKQVEPMIKAYEANTGYLPAENYVPPPDTSGEPVRWWY